MCDPAQELDNAIGTVSDTGQSIISGVNKTVDNIIRNPLPVIETAALMWVLGPEALALDLEPATIAAISNATVSAANGGSVEKIALNFAVAYMGSQAGKAIGSTVSPIEGKTLEQLGPQYADTSLLKQIVTSSSGAAATTALKGGNLNAILTSGISGGVSSSMADALKSQGITNIDNKLLANATASATRAILSGKSVADAIGTSLASTALSEGISKSIDSINKNYDLGAKLIKQIDDLKAEAQKYFSDNKIADLETTAKSNYDLATVNKTTYDKLKAQFDSAYANYTNNKTQANVDAVNSLATQVDAAATKTNDYATKFQDAQKKLEPLVSYYTAHYVEPTNKIVDQMDAVAADNKKLAETVATNVTKYEGQITTDSTGIAKDLYDKGVVTKAVEAYKKADPNYTDESEIKAFFNKQFGRDPTDAEKVQ